MARALSGRNVAPDRKSSAQKRAILWGVAGLAALAAALVAWRFYYNNSADSPPQPDALPALLARIDASAQGGRLPEAIDGAQAALRLRPSDQALRQRLAQWLHSVGRYDEAYAECQRYLASRPHEPQAVFLLAEVCRGRGNNAQAEKLLDDLLQAYPQLAPALTLRGALYLDAGQPDRAIPLLQKALAQAGEGPRPSRTRHYLSQALLKTGREAEAKQVLADLQRQQAVEVWDKYGRVESPAYQVSFAEALLRGGQTKEALGLLEKVIARSPNHAGAHRLLAQHFESLGESGKAAEHRRLAGD